MYLEYKTPWTGNINVHKNICNHKVVVHDVISMAVRYYLCDGFKKNDMDKRPSYINDTLNYGTGSSEFCILT